MLCHRLRRPSLVIVGFLFGLLRSVDAATPLLVTSTADAGAGTLRAAIDAANADASPDPVTITFAIGTGAQSIAPATALPAVTRPVVIDGTSQPGFAGTPLIELRGDAAPAGTSGLVLSGHDGSVVRGLVVNRFAASGGAGGYGIQIAIGSDEHVIAGNYLGTDPTGTTAPGGQRGGIHVRGSNVRIGGDSATDRNVLSGNSDFGVIANAGSGLIVRGNYIGVAADGTARLANGNGLFILDTATNGLFEDNVIAGNNATQVTIGNSTATGHTVRGNAIGVRADGTAVIAGGGTGVNVNGAPHVTIEDNVVGGQFAGAITVGNAGSDHVVIRGNHVGVDAGGTIALPVVRGITVTFSASGSPADVTVGGVGAGEGNVVANATVHGIAVISGFSGNVGQITSPARVAIRGNSLFANAGPGIDLEGDGPTPNDGAPDGDTGANGLQNAPVLTTILVASGATMVHGLLASTPSTTFAVDLHVTETPDPSGFGEGTYLASVEAITDGDGLAEFDAVLPELSVGLGVTATATSADGDTSEFSPAMLVTDDPNATTTTSSTSTTSSSSTSSSSSSTSTTATSSTVTFTTSTTASTTVSTTTSTSSTSSTTLVSTTSTSTTVAAPTTSTTMLACPQTGIPQILCLLDELPPPACDGVTLPKGAVRGLGAARTRLEKATAAPAKKMRRLLTKAAGRMRRVSAAVGKAAARDKVPAACATDLRTGLDGARGLVETLVVGP